jgi:hypothetical protein
MPPSSRSKIKSVKQEHVDGKQAIYLTCIHEVRGSNYLDWKFSWLLSVLSKYPNIALY